MRITKIQYREFPIFHNYGEIASGAIVQIVAVGYSPEEELENLRDWVQTQFIDRVDMDLPLPKRYTEDPEIPS